VLKIGVNYRDNWGSRRKSAFDHRGRQTTAANAADHAYAAVRLGDASEEFGCPIGRSIIDEDRLPLDTGKRNARPAGATRRSTPSCCTLSPAMLACGNPDE